MHLNLGSPLSVNPSAPSAFRFRFLGGSSLAGYCTASDLLGGPPPLAGETKSPGSRNQSGFAAKIANVSPSGCRSESGKSVKGGWMKTAEGSCGDGSAAAWAELLLTSKAVL